MTRKFCASHRSRNKLCVCLLLLIMRISWLLKLSLFWGENVMVLSVLGVHHGAFGDFIGNFCCVVF